MSDLFWLRPFCPKSHGKPRVDDRRVFSCIVFVNRNGLRWRDAPNVYGPPEALCNRLKQWSGGRRVHAHDGGVGDHRRGAKNGHDRRDLLEGALHGIESVGSKGDLGRLIGRTKSGMNTKFNTLADANGRPLSAFKTAGQVSDYTGAAALLG